MALFFIAGNFVVILNLLVDRHIPARQVRGLGGLPGLARGRHPDYGHGLRRKVPQTSGYSSAFQLQGLVIRRLLLQAGEGGRTRGEGAHDHGIAPVSAHRLPARPVAAAAAEVVLQHGRRAGRRRRRAARVVQEIGGRRVQAQDKTGGGAIKQWLTFWSDGARCNKGFTGMDNLKLVILECDSMLLMVLKIVM